MANISLPATGAGTSNLTVAAKYDGGGVVQEITVGAKKTIAVTPTITASSAYAPGNAIGGRMQFVGPGRLNDGAAINRGLIRSVTILDRDSQTRALDLILFGAPFTATTDKTAFTPVWADLANLAALITINDWTAWGGVGIGRANGLNIPYAAGANDLYGQLISVEAPTFTTTSSLVVLLGLDLE